LRTLLLPPTQVSPADGADDIGELKRISLSFASPQSLEDLRSALRIEVRQTPGLGEGQAEQVLRAEDWWLKQEPAGTSNTVSYWINLRHPLPKARHITVRLQLALDEGDNAKSIPFWSSSFRTQKQFTIDRVFCGNNSVDIAQGHARYLQEQALNCAGWRREFPVIEFSRPLGQNNNPGVLRQMFRISPTVANLKTQISDNNLYIRGDYQREVLYRLTLLSEDLPIVDDAKQPLRHSGRQTVFFYFGRQSPILQWQQHRGIVERFGPQMMPVQIRGVQQIDMRIHPIVAGDNRFWPYPDSNVVIDEDAPPPAAGSLPTSPSPSQVPRIPLIEQYLRLLGTPIFSGIISLPRLPTSAEMPFGLDLSNYLRDLLPPHRTLSGSSPNETNQYLLGVRQIGSSAHRSYAWIQVTDLALTTIEQREGVRFAVTSLRTAEPVVDAKIALWGIVGLPQKRQWKVLWQGKTDANGFAILQNPQGMESQPTRIVVQKGQDQLILNAFQAPPMFASNHWWPTYRPWLSWLQSEQVSPLRETYRAHVFTERPVYRPNEPIHIKGIVRELRDGQLALPQGESAAPQLEMIVHGPQQKRWSYNQIKLSTMGGFYRKFQPKDAPAGAYNAQLYGIHPDGRKSYLSSRSFRIEEYRLPRFEVSILAEQRVPADQPFSVRALARYYAGGLVVERPIRWRVIERTISYQPQALKGYYFASNHQFSDAPRYPSRVLIDRVDKIDSRGQAELRLDPTLHLDLSARRYSIEAEVADADGRDVSGYRSMLVLPPFNIGVKLPQRFRLEPGVIRAPLVAVGVDGKFVAGIPLELTLLRREWHSHLMATDFVKGDIRYQTEVVDQPVATCKINSAAGEVTCPLEAKTSGVYILRVQGRDRLGRVQTISVDLYVRGEQPVAWKPSEDAVFKLSLDRKTYNPGDEARVLVRSPFQEARALAIVEDPSGSIYRWIDIKNAQGIFSVPIVRRHAPGLDVHIVLMRGRISAPNKLKQIDPGRPRTVASSIRIPVEASQNRIAVALKLPEHARPQQEIEVEVFLRTPEGRPIAGEVTLWAVDRAVLSLGVEGPLDPIEAFIKQRNSQISIRDTRNLTVGRVPQMPERAGGDGGAEGKHRPIIRQNFKSVAYYNPALQVDASGRAVVRFRLPDDLTSFAVRAVAVSEAYRFGFTARNIQVSLPVMVQRALPRFVRPGDRFQSGGIGRITDGHAGPAVATVTAKGLEIIGSPKQDIALHQRRAVPVFFNFAVPTQFQHQADVQIQLRRVKDGESDAFQVPLPIQQDQRRVYLIREQMVSSLDSAVALLSQWPEAIRQGSGKVDILFAGQGEILRMVAALEDQLEFPYGCTEQRISRAYPMLVLHNTLQHLALQHISSQRVREAVTQTIEHLTSSISRNGLFYFWPGSDPDLSLTAYAVSFLVEAKIAGYKIQESLLTDSVQALRRSLRSDFLPALSAHDLNTRTEVVAALALAKQHEPAYIRSLFQERRKLDLFARSQLLLAMHRDLERHTARIAQLSSELESHISLRQYHNRWQLAEIKFVRQTWYDHSLSARTRTLAAILEALVQAKPGSLFIAPLQQALIDREISTRLGYGWHDREHGSSWGNTQNNARALLALRSLILRQREQTFPKLAFQTYDPTRSQWNQAHNFGGDKHGIWPFTIASDHPLRLRLSGQDPNQPLWIRARISYIPLTQGSKVDSLNRGLHIRRSSAIIDPQQKRETRYFEVKAGETREIDFGTILEETVRLICTREHAHVAVEIPFAAGLEVMNPNLRTASSLAKTSHVNTLNPSHIEYLDDRVRLFFSHLPTGDHRIYFRLRATTGGRFTYPPAHAELMYQPWHFGRSPGYTLIIAHPTTTKE
jgi:hypothetical protein